ncbi:MAG: 1-deoxy-D-xylulose-5-phosphate synthase [Ignavibacteria bacterium]|jgi:1-deoxy-D-xylulose-5-phosphate synthase|nr:1-deoxy-D-xylulose-5-phosphate synthase [Ignavibacteria bacterium]
MNNKLNILDRVNTPIDLRKLPEELLPELATELRKYMIDTVSQTGGHLGSGLGVVELTIALHYVFNTPKDKIIFDVGHQSYPHKILTGRKDLLPTMRQYNGIAGFQRIAESVYDPFGAGHASTSISAALGMSVARDLYNDYLEEDDYFDAKSIAVIGDGSLTGGLAYEALNNAGVQNRGIIVILNDNNRSIDGNVSAFSNYFSALYSSEKVQYWKNTLWNTLGKVGDKGDRVRRLAQKVGNGAKSIITAGMLFEAIGFNYFGPISGHNIPKLIRILRNIKALRGPIFLHVITEKGKGYELAENDERKLHAIGRGYTPQHKKLDFSYQPKYQDIFGITLIKLFNSNPRLVAVSAAMIEGTGLTDLMEQYPTRVFDVGIAEGHAVVFAAGLATQQIVPIVAIYSTFLQRAFDNIIHDCALQKLHIVFAIDRAGLVGEDGATHHGAFDIAYLRIIPNMVVMAPKSGGELAVMLDSAINDYTGCVAIRYPRGSVPSPDLKKYFGNSQPIECGKAEYLTNGKDACVIAVGRMVEFALQAYQTLLSEGIDITVINARFIKPIDTAMLKDVSARWKNIITIEDGQKVGGYGSAVLEYLNEEQIYCKVVIMGIGDKFVQHGDIRTLFKEEGLTNADIVNQVKKCSKIEKNLVD